MMRIAELIALTGIGAVAEWDRHRTLREAPWHVGPGLTSSAGDERYVPCRRFGAMPTPFRPAG